MRRLIQTTALCLALATHASADIVYQGRDAQALHCAAMLALAGALLYKSGKITEERFMSGINVSIKIMSQLPGSESEKQKAFDQRAEKIVRSRSLPQLKEEFTSTGKWCQRDFLR